MSWRDHADLAFREVYETASPAKGQASTPEDGDDEEENVLFFGRSAVPVYQNTRPLSRDDRAYIPAWDPDYEIDELLFEQLAVCVAMDKPVLLVGPRGCGKTSAIVALASAMNQPVRRINLNGQSRVADLVGRRSLEYVEVTDEDGTVRVEQRIGWVDGILPAAMRAGHWLICDEFDAAPPGVLLALQAVLEPGRTLVIPENGGEALTPAGYHPLERDQDGALHPRDQHRTFRLIMTANTVGYGDDTGFYAGTNVINAATMDRVTVIPVDYPDADHERAILESRCRASSADAAHIRGFADKIRSAFAEDNCGINVSTRQLVDWGQMMRYIYASACEATGEEQQSVIIAAAGADVVAARHAVRLAYKMAIGGKLPADDAEFYAGVFNRELGFPSTAV